MDHLDRVIDIAKKLRKFTKKIDNQDVQSLIVDLNLCIADLKLQLAEHHEESLRQTEQHTEQQPQPTATSARHPLAPTYGS